MTAGGAALLQRLNLSDSGERSTLRSVLSEFLSQKGYQVKLLSYRDGIVTVTAPPPECALLRYDAAALSGRLAEVLPSFRSLRVRPMIRTRASES